MATPRAFGRFVFENHWLAIEIVSLLLLIALVGALYLGKSLRNSGAPQSGRETMIVPFGHVLVLSGCSFCLEWFVRWPAET